MSNIFVFSDESGVFDNIHYDYYCFGGIIFLSKEEKNKAARDFHHVEKYIKEKFSINGEMKAANLTNKYKYKLLKSISSYTIFGVVIDLKKVNKNIFYDKKTKQRYLDFAYKLGLKKAFKDLIKEGIIFQNDIENIYVNCDEHVTATNGIYELQESLENEFKRGTYNYNYDEFYEPLFKKLSSVQVKFCDSKNNVYIRMADIIANYLFKMSNHNLTTTLRLHIKNLPSDNLVKPIFINPREEIVTHWSKNVDFYRLL